MNIELTGNPFVDTGMLTMLAHASKSQADELKIESTSDLVESVMTDDGEGFGKWLAKANRQLNSFFMVCTNSALVNSSTNKQLYKLPTDRRQWAILNEEDVGWKDYLETLKQLHTELTTGLERDAPICESCGERPATSVPKLKRVGRDFFPLAGSLGNDAQALPAGSRAPRVCALCLIAIQWLPLGAIVFNGRLACFQFTEPVLSRYFVEDTYRETRKRLETAKVTDKVAAYGSGGGATPAAQILIDKMFKLQEDIKFYTLPEDVSLNIWAFSNSGASPDCEVFEIHNPALQFLWEAARHHYMEISELLKREDSKKPATHLLIAIERAGDYGGFYPRKLGKIITKPANPALYELYQTRILSRPRAALEAAKHLAVLVYERLSSGDKNEQKFLAQVLKENPRWVKDKDVRVGLRKLIAAFAEEGRFRFEQYVYLFPAANLDALEEATPENARALWSEAGASVRASSYGWGLLWFYLHHAANNTLPKSTTDETNITKENEDLAMFTNPKIKQFANDVFAMQLERRGGEDKKRGLAFIKRNIVDGFNRNVTNKVLRDWFCILAKTKSEYAIEDFDALCRDEQGREATNEVRFQMRLEITNLYREAMQSLN